jgi:hypothetical protein
LFGAQSGRKTIQNMIWQRNHLSAEKQSIARRTKIERFRSEQESPLFPQRMPLLCNLLSTRGLVNPEITILARYHLSAHQVLGNYSVEIFFGEFLKLIRIVQVNFSGCKKN